FSDGGAWIDYAGPAGTVSTTSFSDALRGRGDFRGKVVVVGASALNIQDIQSTPAGDNMPGAEINANAIQSVLDGFPLDEAPGWLTIVLITLLGVIAPAAAVPLRGLRWLPAALIALALYVVA